LATRLPIRHSGNENLFLAVEMSLVSTVAGVPLYIHAEGLRGTGKTTVMRWAKTLAPEIVRIKGCLFQCHPDHPHCPVHRGINIEDKKSDFCLEKEKVPMPFVELGHGAKLGTILGSIDLARLTDPAKPEAALLPGAIPMANRGIIFIDEINRLAETAPEITDVLLSVMGTKPGKVKIEEVGLPACEVEVTSSVWAASNPDEDPGPLEEIRKQLADRFDLVVLVQRPTDPEVVEKLLLRKYENDSMVNPSTTGILEKAQRLKNVTVPAYILRYIANLYVRNNVESLRSIEALELSSRVLAAVRGKKQVSFDELLTVLPLTLRHRVEPHVLSEILKDLELRKAASTAVKPSKSNSPMDNPSQERKKPAEKTQTEPAIPAHRQNICEESDVANNFDFRKRGQKNTEVPRLVPKKQEAKNSGWLKKLLTRYRGFVGSGSFSTRPGGNQENKGQNNGGKHRCVSDPTATRPLSPPDPARRISLLSWDEIILLPDRKDDRR